jgi:hypothetical protein
MRGPLLSGPLGSAPALEALARLTAGFDPLVVLGPLWLGHALAASARVLMLVEPDDRAPVVRARRRAVKAGRPLHVALAAAELPLRRGALGALVVENVAGLPPEDAQRWIEALVPCLRPGGRLIAADATARPDAAARVAGVFLAATLIDPAQEWPRDGVVLTVGAAPAAAIAAARFASGAAAGSTGGEPAGAAGGS